MDKPFFLWSIADAWNWLVHVRVLGFILLVILALVILVVIGKIGQSLPPP